MKSKTLLWVGIASFAAATFWAVSTAGVARAATPATEEAVPPSGFRQFYERSPYGQAVGELPQQAPVDWPAAEMREVAFARSRAVIARYEVMRARQMLGEQIDRMRRRFEQTPEFAAAQAAEDEAWAAYQSAHDGVMARLASNDEYVALLNLAGEVGRQIADLKAEAADEQSPAVSPAMLDLAGSKLGYARRASALRAAALSEDPAVAEARARLQTASAKVRQMRADFNDRVRDDQAVLAMRADLFETRIANVAAAAYEDSARLVRRLAWDYAWGLHRAGTYYGAGYYNPYYPYNYGYGYGYGGATVMPVGGNGYGFKRR